MKYIVVRIHNNSLGKTILANDLSEAKDLARGLAEDTWSRPLTGEEIDDLENDLEIFNEEDADNLSCISIGILE